MAIPFLVIGCCSKEIWGEFVSVLLFTLLALQIINWGNKEYLLRQFSLNPGKITRLYSQILWTRFPLVLAFTVFGFVLYPPEFGIWIFCWLAGRYFNHSVEVLLVYEKKFGAAIGIELLSFVGFCCSLYFLSAVFNFYLLLIVYSLYQLLKGLCYFLLFQDYVSFRELKMDFSYFERSFPFFMLSVLGFLASKADVYIIEQLGNKTVTADYQIINSLLVFTMSLSAFIYAPFTKNIYRNTKEVIEKIQKRVAMAGLFLVPVALGIIHFILLLFIDLKLSIFFYCVAFLYVYPCFIYGMDIIDLFRRHQEKKVVWYLLVGTLSNVVLSALGLYLNYGILGVLTGSAMAQLLVLLLLRLKSFEK